MWEVCKCNAAKYSTSSGALRAAAHQQTQVMHRYWCTPTENLNRHSTDILKDNLVLKHLALAILLHAKSSAAAFSCRAADRMDPHCGAFWGKRRHRQRSHAAHESHAQC